MIWIPIFVVLTLFGLHSFMVWSLERDQNLVEGACGLAAIAAGKSRAKMCTIEFNRDMAIARNNRNSAFASARLEFGDDNCPGYH